MHIRTSDGVEVPVEDVLIDPQDGRIVTVVTTVDDRLIPLPWGVIHRGEDHSYATVEFTRERLVSAPCHRALGIDHLQCRSSAEKPDVLHQ